MIEPMKPKQTLAQSEIQDGDIITVQKFLSEKEASALQSAGRYVEVRDYYDYLLHRIKVKFAPKFGPESDDTTFELTLSKRMNYNQLAQKVGEKLKVDPTHLRFSPVNASTGRAKVPIRHTTNHNLGTILAPGYNAYGAAVNQRSDALYYEVLEVSMAELEMRKTFKVTWLPEGLTKEEYHEVLVPKNGTVNDIILALQRKANLSDEVTERIRVYETHANKIFRDCPPNFAVSNLSDYAQLNAEPSPEEDLNRSDEDILIPAFHFDKEVSKAHSIPFIFLVKNGETLKDAKERISKRTGIKGKQFEKVKFAVVSRSAYSKPEYLEDGKHRHLRVTIAKQANMHPDDILSEKLVNRDDLLGLDHPNKNRSGWIRADSIFIR
jgi:ubiquitin carboxyl-terminal hydrolase 7